MKHKFAAGTVIGMALGLSLGLGAALLITGGSDDEDVLIVQTPIEAAAPIDDRQDDPAVSDAASQCEEDLARLKRAYSRNVGEEAENQTSMIDTLEEMLIKAGGADRHGTAMDFPDWLPEPHTERGFTDVFDEIAESCPGVFPEGAQADCSEFPCIVTAETSTPPAWNAHRGCEAWSRNFGDGLGMKARRVHTPDGDIAYTVTFQPRVRDDHEQVHEHMKEYQGNLDKRLEHRGKSLQVEAVLSQNQSACEDDENGASCFAIGDLLHTEDPEKSYDFLSKGCETGHGSSCNNLAWYKCYDGKECDEEALVSAEQAAELSPWDGQGALDTLAYILCKRGQSSEANEAYKRSCEAGYAQNCGKEC